VSPPNSFQRDINPECIARFQRGEMAAFERIYREFDRAAYTLALRITGRAESAQEVLQDAMLKAYQRAGQFRGDAPFWAWLRKLVVNEALMRLRREHGRADEALDEDAHADPHHVAPWLLAEGAALGRALVQLPDHARAVLWLYHVEGLTHVEIAAQFGRSVSFSKSQLARGTQRLRELLHVTVKSSPTETIPCPLDSISPA
jgi:RNA polymerase sigma-70 factor (ECF subfamily)